MTLYILRRLAAAVPLLLGIVLALFLLLELAPGDPVQALVGGYPVSPEYRAQMEEQFGLSRPVHERFLAYVGNLAQGDLGHSFARRRPVTEMIIERLPNTLLLTFAATAIASVVGVGLGVLAAMWRGGARDTGITFAALVGYSVPIFFFGQVLIIVFAVGLGWFPVQGMQTLRTSLTGFERMTDIVWHLVLPALALSMRELGMNARISRASLMQAMDEDYMKTARAKGLSRRQAVLKHGLRNALLPIITVLGYNFGYVLSGSVLIETVFGWPGMGRLVYESVAARDNPMIIGIFLFIGVAVVLVNLVTDILYGILDPRVRVQSSAGQTA